MSEKVRLMSIAFGDEEDREPEIRNTEAVEQETDFLLDEEQTEPP